MRLIVKRPVILSIGFAALTLGLLLEVFLHPPGRSGHFATGFFMGLAVVLLLAGTFRQRRARS